MNNRIKEIRISSKMNQTDFAKAISVSRSAICKIESGENSPSEQTIKLICKEFSVNEEWLRTGKGEMFIPNTRDDMIAELLGDAVKADASNFKRRLISALSRLDDNGWNSLEKLIDLISDIEK